jgi:hypothetical protein
MVKEIIMSSCIASYDEKKRYCKGCCEECPYYAEGEG